MQLRFFFLNDHNGLLSKGVIRRLLIWMTAIFINSFSAPVFNHFRNPLPPFLLLYYSQVLTELNKQQRSGTKDLAPTRLGTWQQGCGTNHAEQARGSQVLVLLKLELWTRHHPHTLPPLLRGQRLPAAPLPTQRPRLCLGLRLTSWTPAREPASGGTSSTPSSFKGLDQEIKPTTLTGLLRSLSGGKRKELQISN